MKLQEIINTTEFIDRINQKLPPREWKSGEVSVKEGFFGLSALPAYFVAVGEKSTAVTIVLNVGWWELKDKAAATTDSSRAFRQVMNLAQVYGVTVDTEFELQEQHG